MSSPPIRFFPLERFIMEYHFRKEQLFNLSEQALYHEEVPCFATKFSEKTR